MLDIRLIASDIDDTILPKGGEISQQTRRAVRACHDKGIAFALASGRWFPSTCLIAEQLGLRGPLIVANGACVVDTDGRILHEDIMTSRDVEETWRILRDSGALLTCYVRGAIYRLNVGSMENRPPEVSAFYAGNCYEVIDDQQERFVAEGLPRPYKLEAYSNDSELLQRLRRELTAKGIAVSSSFRTNIEIMSPGMGKGRAIEWLAQHLHIPIANTMAFGDNTNDLNMLGAVGWPVAVGNAVPEVKAAARVVAKDCADDGVAKFLFENVLGG